MKVLYAEFRARQGCEQRVVELLSELAARVRDEPGNLRFEPYTRLDDRRCYVVLEMYADEAAFRNHLDSQHSRLFNDALRELVEGDGSTLAWLSPVGVTPAAHG